MEWTSRNSAKVSLAHSAICSDASEEIESALEDIERANLNGSAKADLYEATGLIHEAMQLVTGVHQRLA